MLIDLFAALLPSAAILLNLKVGAYNPIFIGNSTLLKYTLLPHLDKCVSYAFLSKDYFPVAIDFAYTLANLIKEESIEI